ncbi:MAG: TolB family protein [Dehalococcoidia bacterium]
MAKAQFRFVIALVAIALAASIGFYVQRPSRAEPVVTTTLYTGWNMLAYVGPTLPVADALAQVEGKFNIVWSLDGSSQSWAGFDPSAPPFLNDLQELQQFLAYMIFMNAQGDLTFDLELAPSPTPTPTPTPTPGPGEVGELIIGEDWRDYGDAPDGTETGYAGSVAIGSFPTKPENNGPSHPWPFKVWLGEFVSVEPEPEVGNDAADDGLQWLELTACDTSSALVMVNLGGLTAAERAQPIFLNLLADWDRDGLWQGEDACAQEWALQNQVLDLSEQSPDSTLAVLAVDFPGGAQVDEFWLRLVVSRQPYDPAVGGELEGETEDYLITGGSLLPPTEEAAASTEVIQGPPGGLSPFFCRGGVVPHGKNGTKLTLLIEQTQRSMEKNFRPTRITVRVGSPRLETQRTVPAAGVKSTNPKVTRDDTTGGRARLKLTLTIGTKKDGPDRLDGPFVLLVRLSGDSNKGPWAHSAVCGFYVDHTAGASEQVSGRDGFRGGPNRSDFKRGGREFYFIYVPHGKYVTLTSDVSDPRRGTYDKGSLTIFGPDGKVTDAGKAGLKKVKVSTDRRVIRAYTKKDPKDRMERVVMRLKGKLRDGTTFWDYYRVMIVHAKKAKTGRLLINREEKAGLLVTRDPSERDAVTYVSDGHAIRSMIPPDEAQWAEETICVAGPGDTLRNIMRGSDASTAYIVDYDQGGSDLILIDGDEDLMPVCRDMDVNLTSYGPGNPYVLHRGSLCNGSIVVSQFSLDPPVDPRLVKVDVDGGGLVDIDIPGFRPSCYADDGEPYVVYSDPRPSGGTDVRGQLLTCHGECVQDAATGGPPLLQASGPNVHLVEAVVSPDGSKMFWVRIIVDAQGDIVDNNIFIGDFDSEAHAVSNVRQLTFEGFNDAPTWSYDSQQIAFVSDRDGNLEIYVMNADGSDQTNITNTPNTDETDPSWQRP